jgi:hypothetical protein
VRSSPAGVRSAFVAAVVVAVALAGTSWFSMQGVQQFHNRAALRRDSIEVTAQVSGFSHRGRHGGILVVNYSFVINGMPIAGKADVPKQLETDVQESSTLPVRYLPANLAMNHPAAWEASAYSVVVPLMCPILPVAIGIMMLVSDHKERRLLAEGLPAIATITESYFNRKIGYVAKYEFRTTDGGLEIGSSTFDDSQQVGCTLCVIYLPRNPRRNLPYPLFDYRIDQ